MPVLHRPVAAGIVTVLAVAAMLLRPGTAALAQATYLSGVVVSGTAPVPGADVSVSGGNVTLHATCDAAGRFSFSTLPVGSYQVRGTAPDGRTATVRVDLGSGGASVTVALLGLEEIGHTGVTVRAPVGRRSGTDVVLNGEALTRSPGAGSFPEMLLQVPGAARGANGVVHINGDHADVNYVINGVSLPQELNRVIGNEVEPANVAFAEVLEGAYPAQYGEKFAAVVNIATRNGLGPAGYTLDTTAGSYAGYDSTLAYHTPAGAGSLLVAVRNERSDRALDPPNLSSPHDAGSDTNQFFRYSVPNKSDVLDVTFTHSLQTYQIPPDVAGGAPAAQDDNESQDDYYGQIQYRHAIGDHGSLSFGPSVKHSQIADFPDYASDIAYGLANAPAADCATNPQDCANSVYANRSSTDYRFNADYALRSPHHEIRAGAVYDLTTVSKDYAIALQPDNPYGPAPFTITDRAPNLGHTYETYLQDSWKMGDAYELDYGLRYDTFQLFSTQFLTGSSQVSPRLKLTRLFGPRASLYVFYGRFFTPYSFENVSPGAAALLYPGRSGSFDLLPQRDSDYEIGGHLPLGAGDLGLRVMQKDATDLIDDTQVGFTNLHQDINYKLGRIATQSLAYQLPLQRQGRAYFSATHTHAEVKDCETQLLAPCFSGPQLDWGPADHDQNWDLNGGLLLNDLHGGWWAFDGEYGSGLTSAYCQPLNDNCKVPPHTTFNLAKGFALLPDLALTVRMINMFNDTYRVTYLNAQGNHYAVPRSLEVGFRLTGR
jgi:hypothetical protein